jgi:hypothetical protein
MRRSQRQDRQWQAGLIKATLILVAFAISRDASQEVYILLGAILAAGLNLSGCVTEP